MKLISGFSNQKEKKKYHKREDGKKSNNCQIANLSVNGKTGKNIKRKDSREIDFTMMVLIYFYIIKNLFAFNLEDSIFYMEAY